MSLPAQLQKQQDDAQKMVEQLNAPVESGDAAPSEPARAAAPAPSEASAPADQTPATPKAVTPSADDGYQQRWLSLQGMYRNLHRQHEQALGQITQLQQAVQQLQSRGVTPAQTAPALEPAKFITDKDTSEFGEEMVDFSRRAAREEVAPVVHAIHKMRKELSEELAAVKQVVPQVQAVAQTQQRSAAQQFFTELTGTLPGWQNQNADPAFQSWLLEADPLTGITRQSYLDDAQNALDVTRVVNIFKAFRPETGAQAPAAPQARTPQQELQMQVAPGRQAQATNAPAKQGKVWTADDVTKLYADKRTGKFNGRDEEFRRLEADMFNAQRDGRFAPAA